ncbi:MAG: response regulator [Anaerolineae bacterium]
MPTILVIDDDNDLREMIRFVLQQTNYDVLLASTGIEGMRLAWQERPDAILLDVMMPRMDGHEVLHRLKNTPETATIPVVMLTAVSAAKQVRGLIEAGAADYVVKPFEPNRLIERLERALALQAPASSHPTPSFVVAHQPGNECDLLVRYLGARGAVTATGSGIEALGAILAEPSSIALLGPGLRDLDGVSVADRLRKSVTAAATYIVGLVPAAHLEHERIGLLSAGFDEVLGLPATHQQIASLVERATQPRTSYSQVRDGIVVLVVVGLDPASTARRLRDAFVDFIGAKLTKYLVDMSDNDGAAAALVHLRPFLEYVVQNGIEVRVVAPLGRLASALAEFEHPPRLYNTIDEALLGWA